MMEVVGFFGFVLMGAVTLVVALNMAYWAGQRKEERDSRRYLDSLNHLQRPKDDR